MGGWKTWLAAIAGICTAVGMIITGFLAEPMDWDMVGKGWAALIAALALIGIGHKVEKASK